MGRSDRFPIGIVVKAGIAVVAVGVWFSVGAAGSVAMSGDRGTPSPPLIQSVIWMGDSIAFDLAPAVTVGLREAGLDVSTYAFAGIGMVGDAWLPAGETWLGHVQEALERSDADVVIWELSAWDLPGQANENRLAHTRFVDLALPGRAAVVFVTPPPVADGAFPYWDEDWTGLEDLAFELAAEHPGRVFVADATPAWGSEYVEFAADGGRLRKPDGVHVCPLGAILFADFLAHWIDDHFAGVAPTDPTGWPTDWMSDDRYVEPPTACVGR